MSLYPLQCRVFLSVLFLYNSSLEIKYQGESIFVSQGGLIVFLSGGGKQALYDVAWNQIQIQGVYFLHSIFIEEERSEIVLLIADHRIWLGKETRPGVQQCQAQGLVFCPWLGLIEDRTGMSFWATFTIRTFLPKHSFMLKSYGVRWWPMWF